MALISCTECQREISDRAATCPGCGAPVAEMVAEAVPEVTHVETRSAMINRPWTFLFWCFMSLLIIGIPFLIAYYLKCRSTRLTVTNKRVRLQIGLLEIQTTDIMVNDVREVQVNQTLLQRFLNTGDLGISSAAGAEIEMKIPGVKDPKGIAATINSFR